MATGRSGVQNIHGTNRNVASSVLASLARPACPACAVCPSAGTVCSARPACPALGMFWRHWPALPALPALSACSAGPACSVRPACPALHCLPTCPACPACAVALLCLPQNVHVWCSEHPFDTNRNVANAHLTSLKDFQNGLIQIRTEKCPNEAIWKQICHSFGMVYFFLTSTQWAPTIKL